MQQVTLTSTQKSKLQNQKQLYVLLRMINFVQKYYSYDKIDQNTYNNEIKKLLEKYNRFNQLINNNNNGTMNLESFCKKYHVSMEQISWAKVVIQKGLSSEVFFFVIINQINVQSNHKKQANLFIQATAKFIQANDTLIMNAQNPIISQIKIPLENLDTILKSLCKILKSQQFTEKYTDYRKMLRNYVSNRSISESLTQSQHKELTVCVQGMYNMMATLTKG